jgi:hypothetical protein
MICKRRRRGLMHEVVNCRLGPELVGERIRPGLKIVK